MFIAVIGGKQCSPEEAQLAKEVGQELARRGAVLICGGLGGVMEAACQGARAKGGITIGILPGDNRREANPYVLFPIATGMGYARNMIVVRSADAVIAIDGGYGTLSEIAYALQKGTPVVGLNTWAFSLNGKEDRSIILASSPAEAVEKTMAAVRRLEASPH